MTIRDHNIKTVNNTNARYENVAITTQRSNFVMKNTMQVHMYYCRIVMMQSMYRDVY